MFILVGTLNAIACQQLDKLEHECPIITKPTEEVFQVNIYIFHVLVHGQVTIIFIVSVGLFVCLFVCAEFFSAIFDPILIKLGHILYVWV